MEVLIFYVCPPICPPNPSETVVSKDTGANILNDKAKLPVESKNTPGIKNTKKKQTNKQTNQALTSGENAF